MKSLLEICLTIAQSLSFACYLDAVSYLCLFLMGIGIVASVAYQRSGGSVFESVFLCIQVIAYQGFWATFFALWSITEGICTM